MSTFQEALKIETDTMTRWVFEKTEQVPLAPQQDTPVFEVLDRRVPEPFPEIPEQEPSEGIIVNPGFLVQDLGPTGEDDDRTARIWGGGLQQYGNNLSKLWVASSPDIGYGGTGGDTISFPGTWRFVTAQYDSADLTYDDYKDEVFDGQSAFVVYARIGTVAQGGSAAVTVDIETAGSLPTDTVPTPSPGGGGTPGVLHWRLATWNVANQKFTVNHRGPLNLPYIVGEILSV